MNTGLLFPGHGSQQPQMLHDLVRHPAVDETLSEVSAVLGLDVLKLDTPEGLQSVISVHLSILTAGVATARALQQSGLQPLAVAGLPVGAFSAAVAADSLSFGRASIDAAATAGTPGHHRQRRVPHRHRPTRRSRLAGSLRCLLRNG